MEAIGNQSISAVSSNNETVSNASSAFQGIINEFNSTLVMEISSYDFAGINARGEADIVSAINNYIFELQNHIDAFASEELQNGAFQGAVKDATDDFIMSVKMLVNLYLSTLRGLVKELQEIFTLYTESSDRLSNQIHQQAVEIRGDARRMNIE